MNHMKDVAQLLGVEIGEEFKVKKEDEDKVDYRYKFTEKGLIGILSNDIRFEALNTLLGILSGEYEMVKLPKPVLDDIEKEYLSYVIKPFRNSVKYFYKFTCANGDYEAIVAKIEAYGYCDSLNFPKFKKGSMYKGMELIKEYSLEELDL